VSYSVKEREGNCPGGNYCPRGKCSERKCPGGICPTPAWTAQCTQQTQSIQYILLTHSQVVRRMQLQWCISWFAYERQGWNCRGVEPPSQFMSQTLIFECRSVLHFNLWENFQTFRQFIMALCLCFRPPVSVSIPGSACASVYCYFVLFLLLLYDTVCEVYK